MIPDYNNLDLHYEKPAYGSSLKTHTAGIAPIASMSLVSTAPVSMSPVIGLEPTESMLYNDHHERFSVFHFNRSALLITIATVSFIALIGLASLIFTNLNTKAKTTTQLSNQYAVSNLPLDGLNINSQLQIGTAEQLAINGQLILNDTLVMSPTDAPATPVTGQLYYNQSTNQPYYYDGTTFVSLQPTTATATSTSPQSTTSTTTTTPTVTSLGGSTGAITLGPGLAMTANQLDIANNLLSSLNASNITSGTIADARLSTNVNLQGNTFNGASQLVQLNASSQLPALSGINLTNINASNISTGTVADTRLSTNVTMQANTFNGIAQLVKTNASGEIPILSGINLTNLNGSNISSGTVADSHLTGNVTVQGNTFNGASQLLQLTAGGILPTIDGSNLTNLNASNVSSGTIADARLSTNVTVQGNSFNGANQLLQLTSGGILPAIDGSNLSNLNASSVTSGTVVDARLSNNVTLQGNTFNGASQLLQLTVGGDLPVISGANLTSINGSNITLGTVDDARLSVNVAFLNNVARQFFVGSIGIGTAFSSSTSMLFVNGVIESWGGLKMPANASAPFTCIPAASGTISLTLFFVTCVCNGSSWVFTNDGSTSCNWLPVPLIPTIGTASDTGTGRAYNNGLATVYFTPSGTGPAATSFTVTSSPGGYTGTGTSSPRTVAGLQSGVLYTFTVTATNVNGTSNPSAASNAITATTIPQAPTIGTATNSGSGRPYNNGLATVGYTANGTGGTAVTYTATASPGGYSASGGSPISVTGLQSATAYTFTVTATNANGSATSGSSNTITATTIPQAPTIGTATTTGNHTASVGYTPNGTGGLGVSYTASPGSGSGGSPIAVSGLAVATAYTFTVVASNANGSSAASAASNSITTTGAVVTGGTLASDATYYYRTFLASGTLGITGSLTSDVLTIAGGGPGGGYGGGGGGAGGVLYSPGQSFSSSKAVVVGDGGVWGVGTTGSNSSVDVLTAIGGGAFVGGTYTANGGSGGGGYSGGSTAGTGITGQGNNGGLGFSAASPNGAGGGGGGAGSAGGGGSFCAAGNGGAGTNAYSSWASATGTGVGGYYAGGAGGSSFTGCNNGSPGSGGAGAWGVSGTANTGSAGGPHGGSGGSGIVIVRYLKTATD